MTTSPRVGSPESGHGQCTKESNARGKWRPKATYLLFRPWRISAITLFPTQQPLPPISASSPSSPSQDARVETPQTSVTEPPLPPTQSISASSEPPLGGHFVDGTQSMFVKPTQAPHRPLPTSVSSVLNSEVKPRPQAEGPLPPDPLTRPASTPAAASPGQQPTQSGSFDPLANVKASQMSNSMRLQPTRPRLDAREAARQLATRF